MRTVAPPAAETISGVATAAGALLFCSNPNVRVTKGGTGAYTITLPVGYVLVGGPTGSPAGGGSFVIGLGGNYGSFSFSATVYNSTTGALSDAQFTFSALAKNTRQAL